MKKLQNIDLNRLSVDDFKKAPKIPIIIVLDNIRSMYNVGSIFRTADAFRIECIHLCGITATPPNKEINKTALGATDSVDWTYFATAVDSVAALKSRGYAIYAIEQTDESIALREFQPDSGKPLAIIFGNEITGVQDNVLSLAHGCIEIPQFGTKHSLNIAVSAGIVLWDLVAKHGMTAQHHL
ncbi:MAG: RNA methyltransferase [Bacteroidetes bacterium]|nr:RNA methyltransferase [Bacteroidota bacterium]